MKQNINDMKKFEAARTANKTLKDRTMEAITERMYSNGGHWLELTVKAIGGTTVLTRMGKSSFERLESDRFILAFPGGIDNTFPDLTLGEVADKILTAGR